MKHTYTLSLVCGLVLAVWGISCTPTVSLQEDIADYQDEIQELEARLQRDPNDADALRDLGVIYVSTGNYEQGRAHLERARSEDPEDAKTLFYLGLAYESLQENQRALATYQRYPEVAFRSPYRDLMQGRSRVLARTLARLEVRSLLEQEAQLGDTLRAATDTLSATTVGVFPLRYQGQNARYAPLGRGLSELMTLDLAKVQRLTVVERVRLQALLDELALAQTENVDPTTAPRTGLLLGAGTVIGGTYNVLGNDVQLDVAAYDIVADETEPPFSEQEALRNLFELEKEAVLRFLDDLGVEVTPQERARIRVIPTQNLEAFLAYSRGLLQEDARQYEQAAQSFRRAAALDPGFEAAEEAASQAESMADAGGSLPDLLALARAMEESASGLDLVDTRMQNMGNSMDTGLIPGPDQRDGPADFLLPPPPPPPPPPDNR